MNASQQAKQQARIIELKLAIQKHGIEVSTDRIWSVLRKKNTSDAGAYAMAVDYQNGNRSLEDLMIEVTG